MSAFPFILYEDDDLLAVNKPSGVNTHKPDRFAQDGIHEWLTKRESRWANLSVLHRLDKDTSGVLVFGKTRRANQSLSQQFESHRVQKTYMFLAAVRPPSSTVKAASQNAVTEFRFVRRHGRFFLVEAVPLTGRTHQIRRHAAESGFPIVGDAQHGGVTAPRLMLHALAIGFEHPSSGREIRIEAPLPAAFERTDPITAAREFRGLLFGEQTNAFRLISGKADGYEGVIVDNYAGNLLVQWQTEEAADKLREALCGVLQGGGAGTPIFEQWVTKQRRSKPQPVLAEHGSRPEDTARGASVEDTRPSAPSVTGTNGRFVVRENGLNFFVAFGEGFSTGIFLDQRENRRRLLRMHLAGKTVLNCFAYTCAFSVAAAKAGALTTSIDLSQHYLEWGRENFRLNGLDPNAHDFIYGDVIGWFKRFAKRGRTWDVVILDPPTFSTSKRGRVFRAARDYRALVLQATPLVKRGGVLFCSTSQRGVSAERFEAVLREAIGGIGRGIEAVSYETQPFDFRVPTGEQPHLKTFWLTLC